MIRRVPPRALDTFLAASNRLGTTALVVLDDGDIAGEAGTIDSPLELMSITKSIASLVIGQLVDRKLLALDQSISEFVPEWKGTPKADISILHVLAHTSGLADRRTTEDIYAAGDFVAFAVAAELEHPPGERYFYSNRASNLLAPIVERASGKRLDTWAREHLFAPLGIADFAWATDRAGNVQVMAGLQMSARDLGRIGQLVLDRGRYGNDQVISESWIEASTASYQGSGAGARGLFWWIDPETREVGFSRGLFDEWRASGVPEEFITRFLHLEGQYFPARAGPDNPFLHAVQRVLVGRDTKLSDRRLQPYYAMTWKAGRRDADVRYGKPRSIFADGWGGQLLLIAPSHRLVVARLRRVAGWSEAEEARTILSVVNEHLLGVPQVKARGSLGMRLAVRVARMVLRWLRRHACRGPGGRSSHQTTRGPAP